MPSFSDLQIEHAVSLLKYANGLDKEIQALLATLEKDVAERLAARLATIDVRGHDLGPTVTARLNKTLAEIRELNGKVYGEAHSRLKRNLSALASDEIQYTAKALSAAYDIEAQAAVASPQRLRSIVSERPLNGKLLESFVKGAEAGTINRIEEQIRIGIAQGESIDKMVRRIRGTKANGYRDGVMEVSKRSATAIVRTSVTHVSNHSQMETFLKNSNLIEGWEFLATLDSRTTLPCASNDGKVFPLGEGPLPPLHPNCRSTITAVTDAAELSDKRASVDGTVKASNFEGWLKRQSRERQDAILGKGRANLWRDGRYKLDDFVRNNREVISLDELRASHPTPKAKATPEPKPEPVGFAPRNPDVNDETIVIESRLKLQKAMTAKFKGEAEAHPWKAPEYRGSKAEHFGRAVFGTEFTDETVSVMRSILPELDAICDRFKVPRLRAFRGIKGIRAVAHMGDSVMSVNASYFNSYAAKLGTGGKSVNLLQRASDDIAARIAEIRVQAKSLKLTHEDLDKRNALIKEFDELDRNKRKLDKQIQEISRAPSEWKIGDEKGTRPFGVDEYFTGTDRIRAVLYHETAHNVHQTYRKDQKRPHRGYLFPMERAIFDLFQKKRSVSGWAESQPSTYATTKANEWFAESFALFMMGRKDLLDEDMIKLIERYLDEA